MLLLYTTFLLIRKENVYTYNKKRGKNIMAMTKSQIEYEKKRMKQCATYTAKYTPKERQESNRIDKYLQDVGLSANKYIKELIKRDLDAKNIPYISDVSEQQGDI